MRYFLLFVALTTFSLSKGLCQSFSFSASTQKALSLDFLLKRGVNRYHVGFSYQLNAAKGKSKADQLANYGRTVLGRGEYFWTIDGGYSRVLGRITLHGELSVGAKNEYTNFKDERFSSDAYHIVTQRNLTGGIGANLGFIVTPKLEIFAGYHTLKAGVFGIRIHT